VLQPGPATLVRGHRSVDEILIFDRSKGWAAFADIRRQLASRDRTESDSLRSLRGTGDKIAGGTGALSPRQPQIRSLLGSDGCGGPSFLEFGATTQQA